jgi:hypothetical protein
MQEPSNSASPMIQLSPYVKELQEFFVTHRMHFGAPEDVVPFTEALSAGGTFHDEMTSMVRSIFLRHGGNVPRAELLQMVMVAVGGPHIDESAEQYLPSIQETVKFLGEVHRTRWGVIPAELPAADAAGTFADRPPQFTPQLPVADQSFPTATAFQPERIDSLPVAVPAESLPVRRTSEIFFRSQMMKTSLEAPAPANDPIPVPHLPAFATPDLAVPSVAAPAVATPEVAAPDVASPDVAPTELAALAVAIPAAAATEVASPIVATPIQTIPEEAPPAVSSPPPVAAPDAALAAQPEAISFAPRESRRVMWISLTIVLLVAAAIAGVLFYEQYVEDKNWPTRNLPPAISAPESAPSLPVKPAAIPPPAASAPVVAKPVHVRPTVKPASIPARRKPLPPAADPPPTSTTSPEPSSVAPETVPVDPQAKPPAPIIRADPSATTPVNPNPGTAPNPQSPQ